MPINRRDFCKLLGLSSGTTSLGWLSAVNAAAGGPNQIVVQIFLRGGADGLHMVVPYGDPDYYAKRPTLAVAPPGNGESHDLDGFFALNSELAHLLPLYDAGSLAFVHASGLVNDTHSHFEAQDLMERGLSADNGTYSGWLGRFAVLNPQPSVFASTALAISPPLTQRAEGHMPFAIENIADFGFALKGDIGDVVSAALETMYMNREPLGDLASGIFDAKAVLDERNPSAIPPDNGAVYPAGDFGDKLRQLAQLIKADMGVRDVTIDLGGWDSHTDQRSMMNPLMASLAAGLSAFSTDLGADMDRVTVLCLTEFGRRVEQNASGGTDHGHGGLMIALGAGVNGGQVHGTWPTLADNALYGPGDVQITTDYRAVLAEFLVKRMGQTQLGNLLPGFQGPHDIGLFHSV